MAFTFPNPTDTDFKLTPPGLYLMRLKDLQETEGKDFTTGEPTTRARWIFEIEQVLDSNDDEAENLVGEEFWAWTSISLGSKSTMRAWVEALLGRTVSKDEPPPAAADVLGKRFKATVVSYVKQSGEPGSKIGGVVPYKPKRAAVAPAAAPPDEDGEELF